MVYKFASRLIGLKVTKQDKDGIVSNGFIACQLIQIVPGVGLGEVDTKEGRKSVYWESPSEIREEIRQAFRASWETCINAGVSPCPWGLDYLTWDEKSKTVFIDGFDMSRHAEPRDTWNGIILVLWSLVREPWKSKKNMSLK